MASTALVTTDNSDVVSHVVPFNRQFYQFDDRFVDEGGVIISAAKAAQKISAEQYASFCTSTSDSKWKDFLYPTNLMFLRASEGPYPYAVFSVAGIENSKFLCNPVPSEVAQKLFPKMHEDALRDPEKYNLKLSGLDESKIKRNQTRIDALKWKPADCQSTDNKSKTLKPCRPKPPSNTPNFWPCSVSNKKIFDDIVKALGPKATSTKRKIGDKDTVDDNTPPSSVSFKTKELLDGMDFEMSVRLSGGTPEFKVVGDRCYLHVYKKPKVALDADDTVVAEEVEEDEDDA